VKNLGDHSASLARIHKGTRVFFEGPYGGFDPEAINANRLVLVGAGVGVAPLRALLEHIPAGRDVDFIARYSKVEEELFVSELTAICKKKNVRLHVLTGPRTQYPLNAPQLKNALPRMSRARVFICGSGAFGEHLREEFLHVGVDPDNIHTEAFAFLPGRSPSSNRSSIPLRSQIETPGSKLEVSSS
jgi:predicted ferric reductase